MSLATEILIAKVIDAAFLAFQANLERDALVARVNAEMAKGMPADEVPELIKRLRDEALARLPKP